MYESREESTFSRLLWTEILYLLHSEMDSHPAHTNLPSLASGNGGERPFQHIIERGMKSEIEVGMYVYMYVCMYVCTVEPQSYETPPSVHKSEMSVTLKSSTSP